MKKLAWVCLLLALPAAAQDYSRSAMPGNGFSYVLGSGQERWPNGQINWYYNPANQPAGLSTDDIVGLFKTATAKWEGMCNLKFNYLGLTDIAPNIDSTWTTKDSKNVFGWGLLTGSRSSYDGYTTWWYALPNSMVDADMMLNSARTWTQSNKLNLEALITHELGHVLGLNHSDVQFAVMAGPGNGTSYNSYSFQRTLRGDDAQACATLYGTSSNAESNRLFNWLEVDSPYSYLFTPAVQPSGTVAGYYYRYYPTTNSYIGTDKNGEVWYLGSDGNLFDAGPMSNFLGTAYGAGF